MPTTDRLPGIHDHAGRRGEHPRGRAHGRRGVPHAEEGARRQAGWRPAVGDEGGFAPNLSSTTRCARLHSAARSRRPATGRATTSMLALDCASTEFFKDGKYEMKGEGKTLTLGRERADYLAALCGDYPILSIEDGCAEDDWDGWKQLTDAPRRPGATGRRRPLRDQPEASGQGASRRAAPTACW